MNKEQILKKTYEELLNQFEELNISLYDIQSVTINNRLQSTKGRCRLRKVIGGWVIAFIEINPGIIIEDHPEVLRDVLAHEMCHAIVGTQGHGPVWKKWAGVVNRHLGTHITTKFSFENYGLAVDVPQCRKPKYIIECPHCGEKWKRARKCKLTEHVNRYRCPVCGSGLVLKTNAGNFSELKS